MKVDEEILDIYTAIIKSGMDMSDISSEELIKFLDFDKDKIGKFISHCEDLIKASDEEILEAFTIATKTKDNTKAFLHSHSKTYTYGKMDSVGILPPIESGFKNNFSPKLGKSVSSI